MDGDRRAGAYSALKKEDDMGARRKYPQFEDWSAEEFAGLLRMCKLSAEDRQIAAQCIVRCKYMIDVGAAHHISRSTVSRRMSGLILPELERMAGRADRTGRTERTKKAGA